MSSDSVKKVQERIFGGGGRPAPLSNDSQGPIDGIPFPSGTAREVPTPLTINIPKPATPQTAPPRKTTEQSPRNADEYTQAPYRLRLAEKLGDDYKGAERYRLEQDNSRKKHWKRWGPYLSDRQWVSFHQDRGRS